MPINCILQQKGSYHMLSDSIPYPMFRMQGQFLEDVWVFATPHPTVLAVHSATKVKPYYVNKKTLSSISILFSSNAQNHQQ